MPLLITLLSLFASDALASTGSCTDGDGDGYCGALDCDDTDRRSYPGAPELLDGADNDCDTIVDEAYRVETRPVARVSLYPGAYVIDCLTQCDIDWDENERFDIRSNSVSGTFYFDYPVNFHTIVVNGSNQSDLFDAVQVDADVTVNGRGGNDDIYTGEGDDIIEGGAGQDDIRTGNGADWIHGGNDRDRLHGGGGPDVFYRAASDLVYDFNAGQGDVWR